MIVTIKKRLNHKRAKSWIKFFSVSKLDSRITLWSSSDICGEILGLKND